jgi:hypothetical protein
MEPAWLWNDPELSRRRSRAPKIGLEGRPALLWLVEECSGVFRQVVGEVVVGGPAKQGAMPFTAVTTYDTVQITPQNDGGDLHFDAKGNPVTDTWEPF